jgi:tetratricopeptide (TPR) repeat protein
MRRVDEMTKTKTVLFILLACFVGCASSQKKIEEARAKDPRYQYSLGVFYLNAGKADEAIRYLQRALSLDPRYYLAYNALGLASSMKGNLQEAMQDYQRCLEIASDFSEARNNLGSVYQELGFIDKAEAEFLRVIADRNYTTKELPNYNLARLYYTSGDYERALACVEAAIKLNARFAMAYNLKGFILEKQDKLLEAIDNYKQAVKIVPEDVNFNFNLGAAYFKNSEWEKAAGIFQTILPQVSDPQMKDKISEYLKTIREKSGAGA